MTSTVLVTGGAGYIGSHACKALAAAGFTPVVYDNLSRGFERAVKWGPFERGDLLDQPRIEAVIQRHKPIAVMHFAAFAYVGESVADPATYYRNNVVGSLALLDAMRVNGVDRLVFSSSCTTYGVRGAEPIGEDTPQAPVNPYGVTKHLIEQAMRDYSAAYGLRAVAMRYFNAAGADPDGEIGEAHDPETHLIPLVLEAAAGGSPLTVFGDDYPTPDGTCIPRLRPRQRPGQRPRAGLPDDGARGRLSGLQPRHWARLLQHGDHRRRPAHHRPRRADQDGPAPRRRSAGAHRRPAQGRSRARLDAACEFGRRHHRHRMALVSAPPCVRGRSRAPPPEPTGRAMCGVNGVFAYRDAAPNPSEAELLAVRDAMAARGPDGRGLWRSQDRRCGFGHRRLAIIDPTERAAQPMQSADGRYVITYNGEIYNFPELKTELEARGVIFRTTSDTEALLHLYVLDGPRMVRALRGMFALAIWDEARQGLFLARDPYGIKPLYVCDDGQSFRFASQVKALLAGGAVSREPDAAGLAGFHLFGHVPEPFTPLSRHPRPSRRLDPVGGPLRRPGRAALRQPAGDPGRGRGRSRAGVRTGRPGSRGGGRQCRRAPAGRRRGGRLPVCWRGLRRHAWADARCGRRNAVRGHLAFAEFEGTAEDEAPLAAEMAARYGARHDVRRVDRAEFEADLPAILEAMDQPSIDGVNTWFVAKAAKAAGLKVAISGLGGDELLAGYPSFVDLPRWRRRFGAWPEYPASDRCRAACSRPWPRPCCASGRRPPACWSSPAVGRASTCCAARSSCRTNCRR